MAVKVPAPAAQVGGVNFGSLSAYSGGQFVPDGDYAVYLDVRNHQAKRADGSPAGPSRLGVMATYYNLSTPTEDTKVEQFYSMGSKADQFFAPNPETGKGVVPIPGASGGGLNNQTNWYYLLKSLYDCGLPEGIFSNDLTVLDGIWVHITNVDEPEERKSIQSATAEVAQEPRRSNKMAIVTEIKEDGKPWEGTGWPTGIPTNGAAPAVKAPAAKPVAVPKPAVKAPAAAARPAAAPVQVTAATVEVVDPELRDACSAGVAVVLSKKAMGLPRMLLRNETFKVLEKSHGNEVSSAVMNAFFESGDDTLLSGILEELGYVIGAAAQIKPAA